MTDRKHVLRGRTAVVTGAARGVGEAVARELADRGASVALIGLEEESLARLAHSAEHVAVRLVNAVERRASSVYVPGWLRGVQAVRAGLPALVSGIARRN